MTRRILAVAALTTLFLESAAIGAQAADAKDQTASQPGVYQELNTAPNGLGLLMAPQDEGGSTILLPTNDEGRVLT